MKPIVHSRRLLHENQVFYIYLDKIEDRGRLIEDYLVIRPKLSASQGVNGAAVFPLIENQVGMLKIYRHAIGGYSWEIPRGFRDPEEKDPRITAQRELEEETGLLCDLSNIRSLGTIIPEAGVVDGRIEIFLAENCSLKGDFVSTEYEIDQVRLFDLDEVGRMIETAMIEDPSTIIGYLKYKNLRH